MSDNHDYPMSRQYRAFVSGDNSDLAVKDQTGLVDHVWLGQLVYNQKAKTYEQQVTVSIETGYKSYDKEQALDFALQAIGAIHIWSGYRVVDATAFRKRGDHYERFWVRYKLQSL